MSAQKVRLKLEPSKSRKYTYIQHHCLPIETACKKCLFSFIILSVMELVCRLDYVNLCNVSWITIDEY